MKDVYGRTALHLLASVEQEAKQHVEMVEAE